jgi:hypothetical protein
VLFTEATIAAMQDAMDGGGNAAATMLPLR